MDAAPLQTCIFCSTCAAAVLLPFHKQLVQLVGIPGGAPCARRFRSGERFLSSPSLALGKGSEATIQMGECAIKNYRRSVELLGSYDSKKSWNG